MKFINLQTEIIDQIMIVTVNRPQKLNALSVSVLTELRDLLTELKADTSKSLRGFILTGAGEKSFIAGADISEMNLMTVDEAEAFSQLGQTVSELFESIPIPVIACVNGYALGGGCEMAMSCDFIYATENALFGQPEVNLGLIPCFGGCVRLLRYIGSGRAKELIYSGRSVTAVEAKQLGLVNQVFSSRSEMLNAARASLQLISSKSYTSVAICKGVINQSFGETTSVALGIEKEGLKKAFQSDEKIIGIAKFLEKRVRPETVI